MNEDLTQNQVKTTENFFKAWEEFSWPDPKPIFYRLYYNEQGYPIAYSMEELPGTYIEIDKETYSKSLPNVRVIDRKIVVIKPPTVIRKLMPDGSGTACSSHDVCIVVDNLQQPNTKWKLVVNEI